MSRTKLILAVVALAAIVGLGSQLQAQSVQVAIAGSSAQWQTQALGAFGGLQSGSTTKGKCGTGLGAKAPCYHYTYKSSTEFQLTDSRVSPANNDAGTIWIVWDSTAEPNTKVWIFVSVDSGVGNRCFFAAPPCTINFPGATSASQIPAPNQQISSVLWGTDTALPATGANNVANLFVATSTYAGVPVTVAATDIRSEDSLWSTCRTNSQAGKNAFDGTDGLGYNGNFSPGVCAPTGSGANGQGNAVKSGYPSSTSTANVLAWAVSGTDPISGNAVISSFSTVSVGAAPIAFVFSRNGGQLNGLTNVTDSQLQTAFSGTKCDADVFGLTSNPIAVYLREPLSGTMNTTEATVFRRPVVASGGALGTSQEAGVSAPYPAVPVNPLTGGVGGSLACPSDTSNGHAGRWRAIGTGEEVKSVLNSVSNTAKIETPGIDGIGYAFFSYGNVSSIANSANYGYATLNGVDPIFLNYNTTSGTGFDPGQPPNGELPAAANLPNVGVTGYCNGAVPCPEWDIWAVNQLSFPNLRSGAYRAWSLLRVVSTGTPLTNETNLIKASQGFVVNSVPDYIPATKVSVTVPAKFTDPGLTLLRSHYQQVDGSGTTDIGGAPVNSGASESGGDMGGCILNASSSQITITINGVKYNNTSTQLIQQDPGGACVVRPTNP